MLDTRKITLPPVLGALSILLGLWMGIGFIRSAAPTFDEPVHLARGAYYWKTGRLLENFADHPHVAEMLSALPLALRGIPPPERRIFDSPFQPAEADRFLYDSGEDADTLLNSARYFSFALWLAALAALVFLLASSLEDRASGWYALVFLFFNPALLSNCALVTTDAGAAVFFTATVFAAMRFARDRGGALWLALAALFSALAMASKFNMALLPLFVLTIWGADSLQDILGGRAGKIFRAMLLYSAASFLFLLLLYRFTEIRHYFLGLAATAKVLAAGKTSFINGIYPAGGVWWYFPYALLVKTPLPTLAFAAAGVLYSLRKGRNAHLWLYAPAFLYLAFAMRSSFQIGVRHVLPVLPFMAVAAGIGARRLFELPRLRHAAAGLVALLALSVLRAHPHYLAYFNEAAGGPERGYRRLADSNLDWGQGLKSLGEYLRKQGSPPIYLSYFGSARPGYYGIRYVPLAGFGRPQVRTGADPCLSERQLLAVSATNLQSVYYADRRFFDWAKERRPDHVAGYSIFVYDLTGDRAAMLKLAGALYRLGLPDEGGCLKRKTESAADVAGTPARRGKEERKR